MKDLSIDDCRGIAARIWCDQDYSHIVMEPNICEGIAQILYNVSSYQYRKACENQTPELAWECVDIGEWKADSYVNNRSFIIDVTSTGKFSIASTHASVIPQDSDARLVDFDDLDSAKHYCHTVEFYSKEK